MGGVLHPANPPLDFSLRFKICPPCEGGHFVGFDLLVRLETASPQYCGVLELTSRANYKQALAAWYFRAPPG